jgi:hypothetical protein
VLGECECIYHSLRAIPIWALPFTVGLFLYRRYCYFHM